MNIDIAEYIEHNGDWGFNLQRLRSAVEAAPEDKEIALRINCCGGDVQEALAIYDYLTGLDGYAIKAQVDGACLSSAMIILATADTIKAAKNSSYLIHDISGWFGGTLSEATAAVEQAQRCKARVAEIFADASTANSAAYLGMMGMETWLDASSLKGFGWPVEVTEETDAAVATLRNCVTQVIDGRQRLAIRNDSPTPDTVELTDEQKEAIAAEVVEKRLAEKETALKAAAEEKATAKIEDLRKSIAEIVALTANNPDQAALVNAYIDGESIESIKAKATALVPPQTSLHNSHGSGGRLDASAATPYERAKARQRLK